MAEIQLGSLERSVLKSLQKSKLATAAEVAAMLPAAGTSEVDSASDALVRNHLVERVPGSTTGAMRLTVDGAKLAESTPDQEEHDGSGGGTSVLS